MDMNSLGKLQAIAAKPDHLSDREQERTLRMIAGLPAMKEPPTTEQRLAELERRVGEQDEELALLRSELAAARSPIVTGERAQELMRRLIRRDLALNRGR